MEYSIEKQHEKGKLHAIERINCLLDKDSFVEIGQKVTNAERNYPYDGVITGYGYIDGILVFIYAQDFTIHGGTVGIKHAEKIANIIEKAIKNKAPIIGINDSGGARIQEGVNSLAGYGKIFKLNTMASGYIPQISIIAGSCAGGAVYSPGITDFIFVIRNISSMYVTGPKIIEEVTGEKCTMDELGGVDVHSQKSGVAHFICEYEKECFKKVRVLVKILSSKSIYNMDFMSYRKKHINNFNSIVPTDSRKIYDMHDLIDAIVDCNSFFEVQKEFAKNVVIGFGKIADITIGIVSNQPNYYAGVLDCDGSDKAARFVRFCDSFEIPLITLVDVPGFLPSKVEEEKGIIRHGAKLLFAYAEANVPKITVIIRKAYGGAYIAMGSKTLGADIVFAWPDTEIAVMGAAGAVDILYCHEIKVNNSEFRQKMEEEYRNKYINGDLALVEGYVDKCIQPKETRKEIFDALKQLGKKKEFIQIPKKHTNIPL